MAVKHGCLLLGLMLLACTAHAEGKRREGGDPGQEALRAVQAKMQQLAQEKMALETEKTALATELETLKKAHIDAAAESKVLDTERTQYRDHAAALNTRLQEYVVALETARRGNDALKHQLQKLEHQHAESERTQSALQETLKSAHAQTTVCEAKNLALYRLSTELVEHYRSKGVWDALLQKEPVTQLKDVEIENLLAEYRDKLNAARTEPTLPP